MTVLRSGSATDVGRVRTSNQDVALEDGVLFAVADGMGGHVGGEVAARVAVEALRSAFQRHPTVEGLREAVAEANRAVWHEGQAERGLRGMGTTLTATALIDGEDDREVIALANVGDSRAYVFSGKRLIQVTADHSLAEEKVRQGQLTEAEAAVHPHRHILTRALGVASDVDVDLWELHLHPGDRILLCSDGLTNEVSDERIRDLLTKVRDPKGAAKRLVRAAVEHGGSDNVTVVVVDVAAGAHGRRSDASGAVPAGRASDDAALGEDVVSTTGPAVEVGATEPRGSALAGRLGEGDLHEHEGPSSAGGQVGPGAEVAPGWLDTGDASGAQSVGVPTEALGATGEPAGGTAPEHGEATMSDPARVGSRRVATASTRGAASAGGLQAAELRRWQTSRRERRRGGRSGGAPRLVTFRVVLFFVLLVGVLAGGYELLKWYATNDWYVTVRHDHLAVYQGRPGGVAWFKPTLVEVTPVKTSEILPYRLRALQRVKDKQEPSLADARQYVRDLRREYRAATQPVSTSTTTTPTTTTSTTPTSTTPSTTTPSTTTPSTTTPTTTTSTTATTATLGTG